MFQGSTPCTATQMNRRQAILTGAAAAILPVRVREGFHLEFNTIETFPPWHGGGHEITDRWWKWGKERGLDFGIGGSQKRLGAFVYSLTSTVTPAQRREMIRYLLRQPEVQAPIVASVLCPCNGSDGGVFREFCAAADQILGADR